jgi:predicted enzyme related to lactoylglutathione lyase
VTTCIGVTGVLLDPPYSADAKRDPEIYAVDDLEVAVAAVRTAGGQVGDIERRSFGLMAECQDDQGLPFYLGQLD